MTTTAPPLLRATGLAKTYEVGGTAFRRAHKVAAVAGVDLALDRGTSLGIVGESGCGKSTLARLVLRLIPISGGSIAFSGEDITAMGERQLRPIRRRMQLIHQNPAAALDPRLTVEAAVAEPLKVHGVARGRALRDRVAQLLVDVGLPGDFLHRYPHELSGGQKQRVCIARALALGPELLVLDEPTSALDVSVQAQILDFLAELRARHGFAYLFISHNLAVVRQVCERVAVMYLGRIVEEGPVEQVFGQPTHPYTRALLGSVPRLGRAGIAAVAPGEPPNPAAPPAGCPFHPRCAFAEDRCRTGAPPVLAATAPDHHAACFVAAEGRLPAASTP
ncbi:peptide/nickel transport system ATP-binding protein/oligopeptide transport system ATP-binding protein [Stella humosa]|uniref:Glutathione import ATP-binding protein GsiA n=1 Tax=Stella humosa TaxID=94 RepID=A0A3N1M8H8_9PROT|nr:oligopeptide/dipeptide ABC transporter ATP-binding protein [Stella humosa]ROQ00023.1 peptide/nickel transport system ATP-binding protein/oligopeptide transport system ATP-binding protein [Stella humosa]BBK30745.1 peptide ABC transporter ATP-binding protein [Stella humosa]